jgi:NAD(P)H-flavin reductase
MDKRLLVPETVAVRAIRDVTDDTVLIEVAFNGERAGDAFSYLPGQFAELSVFGVGECPISITSTPTREALEFAVRDVGNVTRAIHNLEPGGRLGLRGPFGNGFPIEEIKGMDILFVAGGIGLAPLRSLINYTLDNRSDYGRIDIVYGARTPELLCFTWDYDSWRTAPDCGLHLTVDAEAPGWSGRVGFVPQVVKELGLQPGGRVAVVCGPPVMIKFVLADLAQAGYADADVITTLELKMKCGVGKCGRCNIGSKYVCLDGPVFRLSELKALPAEF